MTGRPEFVRWCNLACGYIRFKPDRKAAYEELIDHLRDSAEALEEAGMEGRKAALQAVEQMGDPETTGRRLDRVHNPLLGWLWVFSRWALRISLAMAICSLFPLGERLGQFYRPWPKQQFYSDRIERLAELHPDCQAEYRGYRFSIRQATADRMTSRAESSPLQGELWQGYQLTIVIRSWNPRFWLGEPYLGPYLRLEDSLGNRYVSVWNQDYRTDRPALSLSQSRRFFGATEQKLTIWFDYGQAQALQEARWLDLIYQREGDGFRLRVPLEEGWLDEAG